MACLSSERFADSNRRALFAYVEIFNSTKNPDNCDMMVLERTSSCSDDYFVLREDSLKLLGIHESFSELKRLTKPSLRPVPNYAVVNRTFQLDRKASHPAIAEMHRPSPRAKSRSRASSDSDTGKRRPSPKFNLESFGEEEEEDETSQDEAPYPYAPYSNGHSKPTT